MEREDLGDQTQVYKSGTAMALQAEMATTRISERT